MTLRTVGAHGDVLAHAERMNRVATIGPVEAHGSMGAADVARHRGVDGARRAEPDAGREVVGGLSERDALPELARDGHDSCPPAPPRAMRAAMRRPR